MGDSMKLTTRHALGGAALAVGPVLPKRSPLLAALIAVALGLGLSAEATSADNAGLASERPVGHKIKNTVVPGTELCFNPSEACTAEIRKVRVHLWYPADENQPPGNPNVQYKSQLHGFPLPDPLLPLSWKVDGEIARENAAIDPNGGALPVIVFSHGDRNDPIDYAHTLERIAAGGFIVAAPYHTNNTQDDVRRDFANEQAGTTPPLFPCEDGRPGPCSRGGNVPVSMADRVRDIDRVLDGLPAWFGDRVDVDRAGVLGHSRGTVTALAAAGGTFPLTDARAATANCQSRVNPPFVSPDGVARCWPLAPGMEFGLGRTQADQENNRVGRIKAVMGMAIGGPAVNRGVNLEKVAASTVLYRGSLDKTSPPNNTLTAHNLIGSADKTLGDPDGVLVDPLPGVGHRSFDSTYCDQTQTAGGSADKEELDRIGNGDGHVDALEYEDWKTRAILDFHTARETVLGAGNAVTNNNSVTQFCASETFTSPVDITSVVGSLLGQTSPFNSANAPAAGFVTSDTVKEQMAEEAVDFFRENLPPAA
jgi:predicted dienelactone hydrolase